MKLKKVLAALLVPVCLIGCGQSGEPAEEEPAEEMPAEEASAAETDPYLQRAQGVLETLTLKEKIEQLLVFSIRSFNDGAFQTINPEVEAMLANHKYGGIILFDENISTPGQTAGLNYDLQKAAMENNGIPLLTAVDQEGGPVVRGSGVTSTPGNMALGAAGQTGLVNSAASIIASEISAMGFNTDFAPDADINSEPANPIIGVRSFSDDPLTVAKLSAAYARALSDKGVISCAKHFPGHGNVAVDSHTGLPISERTLDELRLNDLVPFAQLSPDGADMIMTAHICYPNIEQETYVSILDGGTITLPSTLSPTILQGILREELGFDGVIVTDSLMMEAISSHFDQMDAAVLALNAGADILLMPMDVNSSEAIANLDAYVDALVSLVNDRIPEERINEAAERVLRLKAKRGVLDYDGSADRNALIEYADSFVGSDVNHESERAIADQCVTVVKNNDVLPLTGSGHVLLAGVQESHRAILEYGFNQLAGETGYTADTLNISYGKNMPGSLAGYDAVIVTSWLNNMTQFDPSESIMIPQIQALIQNAHASGVPVIVVSTELPYDLSCYEEADGLIAVYSPVGLSYGENGNLTGTIGPNIPAALDIIFGHANPGGMLPVNIPAVEGMGFSDTIVYPRGTGLTW